MTTAKKTTAPTNNIFLYTDLLQYGHWETFIEYAWSNTSVSTTGYNSASQWAKSALGNEDKQLTELFKGNVFDLLDTAEKYFGHLASPDAGSCLRCNSDFRNQQRDFCTLCGWDYTNSKSLQGIELEQAIKINRELNAQKTHQYLKYHKLMHVLKQLEQQTGQYNSEHAFLQDKVKALTEQVGISQDHLETKRQQIDILESKYDALNNEINDMSKSLGTVDSMYKRFEPLTHSNTLTIRANGYLFEATCQHSINFPEDLIMALKHAEVSGQEIMKNASCFVIIKKALWQDAGKNKWFCDAASIVTGQIKKATYLAAFSPLQRAEYKIDFVSKKLVFN